MTGYAFFPWAYLPAGNQCVGISACHPSVMSDVPIPRPFNAREKADLVIRTSDGACLYVLKAFLIYASPFFEKLFADGPPAETYGGLPVYQAPERCQTMVAVLRLCYPPHAGNLTDVFGKIDEALIGALQKYMMENALGVIVDLLRSSAFQMQSPRAIFALACSIERRDLAEVAARAMLREPLGGTPLPKELKSISAYDYGLLINYFVACSDAAPRALDVEQRFDHSKEMWLRWNEDDFEEPVTQTTHGCCKICGEDLTFWVGTRRMSAKPCHKWVLEFMQETQVQLRETPGMSLTDARALTLALQKAQGCPGQTAEKIVSTLEVIEAYVQGGLSAVRFQWDE
ncbi:hypothetical protein BDZ89DRAFT_1164712 [Hymenopellis radicata]|nr:hypothetical protein BDZ89DRAFT_1164712 [Hymenopellis radicata]